ncbi:MAG: hypothetical protein KIG36_06820 [Eubacteriales bacterium]|nr:hypothetical protein [Eubacteriales bacterium]
MELIQPVRSDLVAVVCRVAEEGYPDVLLCVYFSRGSAEDYECWIRPGEIFFLPMTGPKSYADFADLQAGDSLEKLYAIDPSVRYDREINTRTPFMMSTKTTAPSAETTPVFVSFDKYLTDGIFHVKIDINADTVEQLIFYPSNENHVASDYPAVHDPFVPDYTYHDASFLAPLFS